MLHRKFSQDCQDFRVILIQNGLFIDITVKDIDNIMVDAQHATPKFGAGVDSDCWPEADMHLSECPLVCLCVCEQFLVNKISQKLLDGLG